MQRIALNRDHRENDQHGSQEDHLAERAPQQQVRQDNVILCDQDFTGFLVNAIPDILVILNEQRQIVFTNQVLIDRLQLGRVEHALGQRLGEVINCAHSDETAGGCGASDSCRLCGAFQAMNTALGGGRHSTECRLLIKSGAALDFRVWATPLNFQNRTLCIFTLQDISDQKRRQVLEHTFFHDILNTASIIYSYSQLMRMMPEMSEQLVSELQAASDRLISEINAQRSLLAAENDELAIMEERIDINDFMRSLAAQHRQLEVARDKRLIVGLPAEGSVFVSDRALVGRVLGNMLLNALEASSRGQTITFTCTITQDNVCFDVNNPAVMPRKIQLQVFQRSFSTKGTGRGTGTYSMRLISEKYLQGRVTFRSIKGSGTTFTLLLPHHLEP
ncbi:MAG: sensor histidine kinase [Chloroflexota bacterium]